MVMENDAIALDLSDVVHDEPIGNEATADRPPSPNNRDTRSPSALELEAEMSPLPSSHYAGLDTQNRTQTASTSSSEMLERELANLFHQNASAATAALLSAAAQQRQSGGPPSEGQQESAAEAGNSGDIGNYLTGLAAVLQAAQAEAQVNDSDRIALDVLLSAKEPSVLNEKGSRSQTTRAAPSFHSLTAEQSLEPAFKRRRRDDGEERAGFLYEVHSQSEDEGPEVGTTSRQFKQGRNPLPTGNHLPPSTEFPDINDILTQISTQFEPDSDRTHGNSRIPHSQTSGSSVLAPSNRSVIQPIASTSSLLFSSSPPKKGKRSKDSHICDQPDCLKSFTRRSDLLRHMRIHTGERPFVCSHPGCGKTFIQRSALHVHSRVHTGEKPHSCEYPGCGKTFGDSSSLARHRRTHTGKRPYKCEDPRCEKTFTRRTTLTQHMRTHDPEWEPDPNVRYNFKGNAATQTGEDAEDEQFVESVRTISEIFQVGNAVPAPPPAPDSLDRVASISAEIAAAIAQAHQRTFEDEDDEDEEEEGSDSEQEMSTQTIGPNTSGIRGRAEDQATAQQRADSDDDVFPQPLRALKLRTTKRKR